MKKSKKPKEPEGPKQGDVTVTIVVGGGVVLRFTGKLDEYQIIRHRLPLLFNTFRLSMTNHDLGALELAFQPPAPLDPSMVMGTGG